MFQISIIRALNLPALRSPQGEGWVSDFDIRISDFNHSGCFMQNEPNLHRGKNESNPIHKKGLREFYTPSDNEKRTQNEPNFKIGKI